MPMVFYDTCALLELQKEAFKNSNDKFLISNITFKELEHIKNAANKDPDIKYKARKLIHLLSEKENRYTVINYQKKWDNLLKSSQILNDNNDSRIIISALRCEQPIIFVTGDLNCKQLAQSSGLTVEYIKPPTDDYTGFKVMSYATEDEDGLANIYNKLYLSSLDNYWQMLDNEYLLIKNTTDDEIIDQYKYTKEQGFIKIPFPCFESKMFGKVKPKDAYQTIAMDSLKSNKLTMIRGSAGTGKSYLALGYLFSQLEKHKIDKIIIFCNTVATTGAAKLGLIIG